jgi:hypothetical protein
VQRELYTWSDAGDRVDETGVTTTAATSGQAARHTVERLAAARHDPAIRPVFVRSALTGLRAGGWSGNTPPRHPDLPPAEALRDSWRHGDSIAHITSRSVTPLAIMLAFEESFAPTSCATPTPAATAWPRSSAPSASPASAASSSS